MSVPAVHCEARKTSYRQTKDGLVVSFVIHPNDMPDALAVAPLGQRYMLALAQIGDDEEPVSPSLAVDRQPLRGKAGVAPDPPLAPPANQRRPWETLSPQQQAGILCSDVAFQKFAAEKAGILPSRCDDIDAAAWLRFWLGVESRKEIAANPEAIAKLNDIRAEFLEWAGRVPVAVR